MSTNEIKMRPVGNRIICRVLKVEDEVSKGGIHIPDAAKERPTLALVLAVGPGEVNEDGNRNPVDVRAGNHIYFGKYSGATIEHDGDELLILRETDVLAVVD